MAAAGVLVGRGYVSIRPEFEGDWSQSASARGAAAGKSGGAAFSKAFGIGLKGIGALAGVAIAANLNAAGAGAAALAPALATAGAAAGALKLGLSGVSDAFKAAFSDSAADAKAAASATKAVEGAQRGLANAQRALSQAQVDAAKRVKDAQRGVLDAERDLADAQRDARDVQKDLNSARQDATRALEDMNLRLEQSQLDERDAALRLTEAQRELSAARANPGTTPAELAKLQLAYDKAVLNLKEQKTETKRLAADTKAANKAGVEGSEQVVAAKKKISDANATVAEKERALSDAQAGVAEARADGARQIADAQRAVADAAAAVADAQAAAAAQTSQLDEAMSKLAPNARSFVGAVQGLAPAWRDMKLSVQNALFKGLDSTVTTLGRTTIPVLKEGLTATAGVWNQIAKSAASGITEMAKSGMLKQILDGATDNLRAFKDAPKQILTAFGQLTVAAQPAFNGLMTQFAGAIQSFTDGIAKSFASGGLQTAIDSAFGILSQFGMLLGNVLGTVSQIFKAASDAGGQIVGVLGEVFGELRKVLATDQMQATMRALFTSIAQIVGALVPVIGAVVQAAVPLLAAIAQPIAELAVVLGPVLQQLVAVVGASLMPVIQALMPALVQVGTAIVEIVRSVMPLLEPIATLIGAVISALAPALTPVIAIVQQLVTLLVGPLAQIVEALTPVLAGIGETISRVFAALQPMLAPLVLLLGQVVQLFADTLVAVLDQVLPSLEPLLEVGMQLVTTVFEALAPLLPVISEAFGMLGEALATVLPALMPLQQAGVQLVQALVPLIPIGVQLVTTVFEALLPVLPTIADTFVVLSGALVQIVGPLAEVVASLVSGLAPILTDLSGYLGEFVGLLAQTLADVLPPLASTLVTLVGAFTPLLPVVGDLARLLLGMVAGVLRQLLPSLLELVMASVKLTVALLPLLPPLAKLLVLVVDLAVKVLDWLLPPLISLAGFLIGALAGALSTAIGWVAGILGAVASLTTFVVGSLGPAMTWLRDKVIVPVWNTIKSVVSGAWTKVLKPTFGYIKTGIEALGNAAKWLRDKAVKPAWDGIVTVLGTVWKSGIKPAFDTLKRGVEAISDSFDTARKAIKTAWDKLKDITKTPVKFIIDVIYNGGIRKVWNVIAGAFGAPKLDKVTYAFAQGGILPGYTPGRDPHTFYSPSGMSLAMSGGESIMRPEFTRGAGAGFVSYFNSLAKSRGAAGVREALAPVLGGNPVTGVDRSLRYAGGGIHQAFADGGVFGWIKSAGSAVLGAGSSAWNKLKESASWLADTLEASARAGIDAVVDPLMKNFPGASGGFGKMLRAIPKKIIDTVVGYGKAADGKGAGGIGGPRIQAALRWARTQNGLPYQWGGNGDPSWDCSGLVSAIESVIRGQKPHRRWATGAFSGKTAPPGWVYHGASPFRIGITNAGVGHTAGTLGGTNVESRGGDGVIIGPRARGYKDKLFTSWYGFQPGKYDAGGWLGPGQLGVNQLRQPEAILTPSQWRTMTSLAATSGGATRFEGDLYLDSGEFLGRVRGEAQQVMQQGQRELLAAMNAS
ncbi:hypothetical protein [Streptomyces antibioticus]|uniref:hypothetical protein n=1 Tax=Streptomyces antibioticus TaxID=1890 RepID=UPI0036FE0AAC